MEERILLQGLVLRLEQAGRVTRTFRRLDPDRQMAVVEALLKDAAEHGPEALSVKRVAAAAGVAVGSLYQYFPHRGGMVEFAAEAAAGFLTASLTGYQEAIAGLPLREGLLIYLSAGIEWTEERSGLLRFFARVAYGGGAAAFGETLVRPVGEAMRGLLSALLRGAGERGELRPGLDVAEAARLVHAITAVVADTVLLPHLNDYLLLYDDTHEPAWVHERTVDFIVAAIGAPSGDDRRNGV
jgi:AcrR family transcriptional regulator